MLEVKISEEQQVHVIRCLGVVLVGMGDWRGVNKFSAKEIREPSLSGHVAHFQILVLWATHLHPQLSHHSLHLPTVPCFIWAEIRTVWSYCLRYFVRQDYHMFRKQLIFHSRLTLSLCGGHGCRHMKGASSGNSRAGLPVPMPGLYEQECPET